MNQIDKSVDVPVVSTENFLPIFIDGCVMNLETVGSTDQKSWFCDFCNKARFSLKKSKLLFAP